MSWLGTMHACRNMGISQPHNVPAHTHPSPVPSTDTSLAPRGDGWSWTGRQQGPCQHDVGRDGLRGEMRGLGVHRGVCLQH